MFHGETFRVLLVEDDEDDYIITRDLFREMPCQNFTLEWVNTFEKGLETMVLNQHDVCLVDYRLGAHNGIDLLRAAIAKGCQSPVILLTGAGEHEIDLQAMQAGAADYLVKTELQSNALERSIRYAMQRKKATALAAFEQARLAAFGSQIGLALTRKDSLPGVLGRCSEAMVQYLNAGLAQISVFNPTARQFESAARSGPLAEIITKSSFVQELQIDATELAGGKSILIKLSERMGASEAVGRLTASGVVSYAAVPLLLEEKLLGLMAVFSEQQLTDQILLEMGSVAHGLALCIEQKRSEQALGVSESKYRSVVESIKEVIFQLNEFGHWTFLNPAWTQLTGFEVTATIGTFFLDYFCQEDRQQTEEIFLKLGNRTLDYCRYEARFLHRDGKVKWVEIYAQRGARADEGLPGISGTITDVTERKVAESKIQKLAAFPQVSPNPVLEFAADGSLSYANAAARQLAAMLNQTDVLAILPPHAGELARDSLKTGRTSVREEVRMRGRTLTWSFFPVPSSQVVHCYGADVTDVLSLEAQLRHAQKLESVGQLAAGVAHDFNNILTVIQGYADCLLSRCAGDVTTARALKQIGDASKRAAALTRQLLAFSRKQVIQLKILDLNQVLQNLATMLPRLLGEDVIVEMSYAEPVGRIEGDTGMLEQVVMNLVVNARDAMPKGGRLWLTTESVDLDGDYVRRHPESRVGRFVALRVRDSGCGMDAATLERIFEPFFTTKEVGKGTGLGLATVYGIVKQHQGWVDVQSAKGQGTTFTIYLPSIVAPASGSSQSPEETKTIRGGNETILLVEDEPVLRELILDVLKQYNYRVIQAGSGVEALRVWDEHNADVDLLLTDMVMPDGLNGRELADQLKKRKPGLKVIFSSGYSSDSLGKDFCQGDTVFLPKPYLPPQLAQIVRSCLDKNSSGAAPSGNKTELALLN
jgi:two-component system cell cycle sensor histidine kinase/response regulator CckA